MIRGMTDRSARLLRRRTTDRVIGGVAGGLGDYFNVDPLLIRIGFVGLIIFGGAGLVLYLIAWLLLPAEGHDASMVERFFRASASRGVGWSGRRSRSSPSSSPRRRSTQAAISRSATVRASMGRASWR